MIEVRGTSELRLAAAFYGRMDRPTRDAVRDAARGWAPGLVAAARGNAVGEVQAAVAGSGRTTSTSKALVATFGAAGSLHGEPLRLLAAPYEFGGNREKTTTYLSRHRISGRSMRVTRRTARQLPRRKATGWFVHPAVAEETPRLVGLWVKAITAVAEGRRG